jgi:alkanesulfonate monooxygenase SsuD/methylene tetrahydromethanopterin reductase-like flavin-dependent oxidoreductase (luciferase family)
MSRIRFGVWLPNHLITYPPPHPYFRAILSNLNELNFNTIKKIALKSERLGYDAVWICDHLSWDEIKVWLECWTLLSALSSVTNKIRLGSIVLCNLYRHPSILASMGATLDLISDGRLELGIGAGWNRVECEKNGIAFPTRKNRLDMLSRKIFSPKRCI